MLMTSAAIGTYTSGEQEADFVADRPLIDAVEQTIERISEASRRPAPPVLLAGQIAGSAVERKTSIMPYGRRGRK
jgi:hypothetical protein